MKYVLANRSSVSLSLSLIVQKIRCTSTCLRSKYNVDSRLGRIPKQFLFQSTDRTTCSTQRANHPRWRFSTHRQTRPPAATTSRPPRPASASAVTYALASKIFSPGRLSPSSHPWSASSDHGLSTFSTVGRSSKRGTTPGSFRASTPPLGVFVRTNNGRARLRLLLLPTGELRLRDLWSGR